MKSMPLIIANWKANPLTITVAKELFIDIRKGVRNLNAVEIAVAPPYPYLQELNKLSPSGRITIAAQDVFYEQGGAYTGEVSLSMLQSVGVGMCIIGHSERRALGETDGDVQKKVVTCLKHNITTVVCVGEKNRDNSGDYLSFVEAQVRSVLSVVKQNQRKHLVFAYEPIWAIGTGNTATPADAYEMKLFIQKVITEVCGRAAVKHIRIIYGGSVKSHNAAELLTDGEVDGFLVGGASLKPSEFISIAKVAMINDKE